MLLILGIVFLIFFVSLSLTFISVSFSISSEAKVQRIILDYKKQEFNKTEAQEVKNEIIKSNKDLVALDNFYNKSTSFTNFLERISRLLPQGVYLNNISINSLDKGGNSYQVSLSGVANFIEDLIALNDNLKKDGSTRQIIFPGNIWLETKDVNFNVSFQITISK